MPEKLQVIALISGGKDSLFSILHCLAQGHEVVALANLYPAPASPDQPADVEGEDLDSFMYQTVGHSIIPLYEQALKLPLYRQPIYGGAVVTGREYAPQTENLSNEDETESLVPLLKKVLQDHPTANAVSTGAILSTYQRTRVESVCVRLGLASLGYLWQYPSLPPYAESSLLHDMGAVGQDARIIKVASGGIDTDFLWENVAARRTVEKLRRAAGRFGGEGAVLGEGGEFETLAVAGPRILWKGGRIEVHVDPEPVRGDGGSAVVRFTGAKVEDSAVEDGLQNLRIPDILDVEFEELGKQSPEEILPKDEAVDSTRSESAIFSQTPPHLLQTTYVHRSTLTISNLISPLDAAPSDPSSQLTNIVTDLRQILADHDVTPASISSTTLLLRSMTLFVTLNPIYGALFTAPVPPARVTVACGDSLPSGVDVMLSCTVDLVGSPGERRGLHVQSRSYWAPANIGPYSQAVAVPASTASNTDVVHLAGQIPLVPASMTTVTVSDVPALKNVSEFGVQTVVALQHLWRIGRVMNVHWWTCGVAFISDCSREEGNRRASIASRAWRGIHEIMHRPFEQHEEEDDDDVDVWDMKYGGRGPAALEPEKDRRPALPDYNRVQGRSLTPPCFVAQVLSLPRDAQIEWTSPGLSARSSTVTLKSVTSGTAAGHPVEVFSAQPGNDGTAFFMVGITHASQLEELKQVLAPAGLPEETPTEEKKEEGDVDAVFTVYVAGELPRAWLEAVKPTIVPCKRVWGSDGSELLAGVVIRKFGS
ncbi:uncharacterized protein J3D65DRAFT_635832 [Phyllosticta citribraziliensis]|uniref:Diphthine--ammonia ligase n=1 Tax=Phyllosticta citribraziliensis TaxID=989973 RepID=A0ABR1LA53_9PEZI